MATTTASAGAFQSTAKSTAGVNGEGWRASSARDDWKNSKFDAACANMDGNWNGPGYIRIPGGTTVNYYDWNSGLFIMNGSGPEGIVAGGPGSGDSFTIQQMLDNCIAQGAEPLIQLNMCSLTAANATAVDGSPSPARFVRTDTITHFNADIAQLVTNQVGAPNSTNSMIDTIIGYMRANGYNSSWVPSFIELGNELYLTGSPAAGSVYGTNTLTVSGTTTSTYVIATKAFLSAIRAKIKGSTAWGTTVQIAACGLLEAWSVGIPAGGLASISPSWQKYLVEDATINGANGVNGYTFHRYFNSCATGLTSNAQFWDNINGPWTGWNPPSATGNGGILTDYNRNYTFQRVTGGHTWSQPANSSITPLPAGTQAWYTEFNFSGDAYMQGTWAHGLGVAAVCVEMLNDLDSSNNFITGMLGPHALNGGGDFNMIQGAGSPPVYTISPFARAMGIVYAAANGATSRAPLSFTAGTQNIAYTSTLTGTPSNTCPRYMGVMFQGPVKKSILILNLDSVANTVTLPTAFHNSKCVAETWAGSTPSDTSPSNTNPAVTSGGVVVLPAFSITVINTPITLKPYNSGLFDYAKTPHSKYLVNGLKGPSGGYLIQGVSIEINWGQLQANAKDPLINNPSASGAAGGVAYINSRIEAAYNAGIKHVKLRILCGADAPTNIKKLDGNSANNIHVGVQSATGTVGKFWIAGGELQEAYRDLVNRLAVLYDDPSQGATIPGSGGVTYSSMVHGIWMCAASCVYAEPFQRNGDTDVPIPGTTNPIRYYSTWASLQGNIPATTPYNGGTVGSITNPDTTAQDEAAIKDIHHMNARSFVHTAIEIPINGYDPASGDVYPSATDMCPQMVAAEPLGQVVFGITNVQNPQISPSAMLSFMQGLTTPSQGQTATTNRLGGNSHYPLPASQAGAYLFNAVVDASDSAVRYGFCAMELPSGYDSPYGSYPDPSSGTAYSNLPLMTDGTRPHFNHFTSDATNELDCFDAMNQYLIDQAPAATAGCAFVQDATGTCLSSLSPSKISTSTHTTAEQSDFVWRVDSLMDLSSGTFYMGTNTSVKTANVAPSVHLIAATSAVPTDFQITAVMNVNITYTNVVVPTGTSSLTASGFAITAIFNTTITLSSAILTKATLPVATAVISVPAPEIDTITTIYQPSLTIGVGLASVDTSTTVPAVLWNVSLNPARVPTTTTVPQQIFNAIINPARVPTTTTVAGFVSTSVNVPAINSTVLVPTPTISLAAGGITTLQANSFSAALKTNVSSIQPTGKPIQRFIPYHLASSFTGGQNGANALAAKADVISGMPGMFDVYLAGMKATNPSLTVLQYVNGTTTPVSNLASGYLLDQNNVRVTVTATGQYLMDPLNSTWQTTVQASVQSALNIGYDGIVLDGLGPDPIITPGFVSALPVKVGTPSNYTANGFVTDTTVLATIIKASVRFKVVVAADLGSASVYFGSSPTSTVYSGADSGVSMSWLRTPSSSFTTFPTVNDWLSHTNMLSDSQSKARNMMVTTQVLGSPTNLQLDQWHRYALTSFLMTTDGETGYFSFVSGTTESALSTDYTYQHVDLGMPTTVAIAETAGHYVRLFEHGIVLCNPTSNPLTFKVSGSWVNLNGTQLSAFPMYPTTSAVVLPAHSGDILVNNSIPVPVTGGLPGAPTNVAATPEALAATVTWVPPSSNGNRRITSNTISIFINGIVVGRAIVSGNANTATIGNLTSGTGYTFTVFATNSLGNGPASVATNQVVPVPGQTIPNQPTGLVATAGDTQVSLSFTVPTNGNSPLTSFVAHLSQGATNTTQTFNVAASPPAAGSTYTVVCVGLTNNVTYSINVTAVNGIGASIPSNGVTATPQPGKPGAPGTPAASQIGRTTSASVSWSAATSSTSISFYTIIPFDITTSTTLPGQNTTGFPAPTSWTVTGLTQGHSFSFTVTATNTGGTGPASSASNIVTMQSSATVPSAPTITASQTNGGATVSWSSNGDGGSAITGWTLSVSPSIPSSPFTYSAATTSATLSSMTNGTTYTLSLTANNSVGSSSSGSTTVTPQQPVTRSLQTMANINQAGGTITNAQASKYDVVVMQPTQATVGGASGTAYVCYFKGPHMSAGEYHNGTSQGAPGPANGTNWPSSWFATDSSGNRVGTGGTVPCMNIKTTGGGTYLDWRVSVCVNQLTGTNSAYNTNPSTHWDGVFLDVMGPDYVNSAKIMGTSTNSTPCIPGTTTPYTVSTFMDECATANKYLYEQILARSGRSINKLLVIPNGLSGPGSWGNTQKGYGVNNQAIWSYVEESFLQSQGASAEIPIISQITGTVGTPSGKIWAGICKLWNGANVGGPTTFPANPTVSGPDAIKYAMAVVMVSHNGYSSSLFGFESGTVTSNPPLSDLTGDYTAWTNIAIGDPVSGPGSMVSANGIYGRAYTYGYVLLNTKTTAGSTTTSFTLPAGQYQEYYTGSPTFIGGQTLSVPNNSGYFLLKTA